MSEAKPEQGSQSRIRKRIVPFEESGPDNEPTFINYVQAAQAGGVGYLDVGVIPLDEILERSDSATFCVLSRLVMSRETMATLRDQITQLLEQANGHTSVTQDSSER